MERDTRAFDPPRGYNPEISRWVWALEDTRLRTLSAMEGLLPAELDWLPSPDVNSIGTLLYHVAAIEASYLFEDILAQPFPPQIDLLFPHDVRDERGRLTPIRGAPLQEYLDRLSRVRVSLMACLREMTVEDFRRERSLPDYSITPEWAVHHLMQHEAEHRGQIETLRGAARRARDSGD